MVVARISEKCAFPGARGKAWRKWLLQHPSEKTDHSRRTTSRSAAVRAGDFSRGQGSGGYNPTAFPPRTSLAVLRHFLAAALAWLRSAPAFLSGPWLVLVHLHSR